MREVRIVPVEGLGEVVEGTDLGASCARAAGGLGDGEVLVVSQKVVSKAEGRLRNLRDVEPSGPAEELARRLDKDPRIVEVVLAESVRIVRAEGSVLITETASGLVCANSGVDSSNVPGEDTVVLLPADPDASARRIRDQVEAACGARPAVVVADSFGRPWRLGQTDVAIGCAGIDPMRDERGAPDREGRELTATAIAVADELAAAADLVRFKADGIPAVRILGLEGEVAPGDGPGAAALRRPAAEDLFR